MPSSSERPEALPDSLSDTQRAVIGRMVAELAKVPGVAAVSLGGSHARGRARPDSDVDLGIYYHREPALDVASLRQLAQRAAGGSASTVTDCGVWGPWADGGAWLRVDGEAVDWVYRDLDRLDDVVADGLVGRIELHYGQQPPAGFHSHTYLAELHVCRVLWDEDGSLGRLKERVAVYPEALARTIVHTGLENVDFTLFHARAGAARGDVAYTVRCLARAAGYLDQVIFALNRAWFVNDKTAAAEIDGFPNRPPDYVATWSSVLGAVGSTTTDLAKSVARIDELYRAVVAIDPQGFSPRFAGGKPGA